MVGLGKKLQALLGFTRGLNACAKHTSVLHHSLPEAYWEEAEAALFSQLVDQYEFKSKEGELRKLVINKADGCMVCYGGDVILHRALKQVRLAHKT